MVYSKRGRTSQTHQFHCNMQEEEKMGADRAMYGFGGRKLSELLLSGSFQMRRRQNNLSREERWKACLSMDIKGKLEK